MAEGKGALDNLNEKEAWRLFSEISPLLSKINMEKGKRPCWDSYFMLLAKLAASRSTCLSRPTGAIIVRDKRVLATGYNCALSKMPDCLSEGHCYRRAHGFKEGLLKYDVCRSSHAEKNAIAYAANSGISIEGSTIYATLHPCIDCAKLIIASGIKEVVYEFGYESGKEERDVLWKEFLKKSGIKVRQHTLIKKEIGYVLPFLLGITSERRLSPTD